jgi:hypothetical protein
LLVSAVSSVVSNEKLYQQFRMNCWYFTGLWTHQMLAANSKHNKVKHGH